MSATRSRTIKVDYLARVEGEGGMTIKLRGGEVADVKLRIFEPPRFFEAFLVGRDFKEVPDITARICGICPVAYQMSSTHAMEAICGVTVGGALRELRRLLYCGEWIESHVLHAVMLHAPDFLGYPSVIEMAADHPELAKKALRLKKIGNDLMVLVGGREIHPINVRVGGFYRIPTRADLLGIRDDLVWARDAAQDLADWVGSLEYPSLERDYRFVALRHPAEYPLCEGRIVSSTGLDLDIREYEDHFVEEHVPHANALHSHLRDGGNYFVGPLARYALNRDKLTPGALAAAERIGLPETVRNPFRSIAVRMVETIYACEEALRIVDAYREPEAPFIPVEPRAGTGHGASEAPRGTLYHRYSIDGAGAVREARIVPPTAQNQPTIEEDLRVFVSARMDMDHARLQWECEQAIRNYDPCISCATHFLKLTVELE